MKKRTLLLTVNAIGIPLAISMLLVCIAIATFFAWFFYIVFAWDWTVSTFADISECEEIVAYARERGGSWTPRSASSDEHANELAYTQYFGGEYQDASCSFEIYAYVFADTESAETYYSRASAGRGGRNPTYSEGLGLFGAERVVLNGNAVYAVYMPSRYHQEVIKLLAEVFSITLFEG